MRQLRDKRGFTMIEMIVAIAVVAILLAIAIPSMAHYLLTSEMMKVNQTARTFYLSAQDYLTEAYISGSLSEVNAAAQPISESVETMPQMEESAASNRESFVYLSLCKQDAQSVGGDYVREILGRFVGDTTMLDQSVLIEYSKETGVVLSVFYSEQADFLDYVSSERENTNVVNRTVGSLRDKRLGYYGVTAAGEANAPEPLGKPDIRIVNGERLYVEWNDITPSGDGLQSLTYSLTIYSEDWETEYLRIDNIPNSFHKGYTLPKSLAQAEDQLVASLPTAWNGVWVTDAEKQKHHLASYIQNGQVKMAILLDDVHDSIYERYPTIPAGKIHARIEPTLDWLDAPESHTERAVHAYFGDSTNTLSGTFFSKQASTFSIENVRHLNNIRYAVPDYNYWQKNDIDWSIPESAAQSPSAKGAIPFEVMTFRYHIYSSANGMDGVLQLESDGKPKETRVLDGFRGQYAGGKRKISNVVLTPATEKSVGATGLYKSADGLGLFARLNGGALDQIRLVGLTAKFDTDGTAYTNVGALAGVATDAQISGCTVETATDARAVTSVITATTRKAAAQWEASVGGIVGSANNSVIKDCTNTADVTAGQVKPSDSADAALWDCMQVTDSGSYVGGIVGKATDTTLSNCQNTGNVLGADFVGGIAGQTNKGAGMTAALVEGCRTVVGGHADGYHLITGRKAVGGVVGENSGGTIRSSSCTEEAFLPDKALTQALKDYPNEIKRRNARVFTRSYTGILGTENVGGVVGSNRDGILGNVSCNAQVEGSSSVGGVVGLNAGSGGVGVFGEEALVIVRDSAAAVTNSLVVCTGDYAGGVYGKNLASGGIRELTGTAHVVAQRYVGGIVGANGEDTRIPRDELTISDCKSVGVVYAYSNGLTGDGRIEGSYAGGIAGINMGIISDCSASAADASALSALLKGLSYSDYVGGIAGYNGNLIRNCTSGSLVVGNRYVGGITGKNDGVGKILNCSTAGGIVKATGNFAGGVIGLNTTDQFSDTDAVQGGLKSNSARVEGKYCVGGVIGANITASGILALNAQNGDVGSTATVVGEALVGGIVGYNCKNTDGETLNNPFTNDLLQSAGVDVNSKTILVNCSNYSQVKGARYVGGIIGLNSSDTRLELKGCQNRGAISYVKGTVSAGDLQSLSANGNYYIAGITGRNTVNGVISGCSNSGKVTNGSTYTGGLVEINEGIIFKCESSAAVAGRNASGETKDYVGGIAGMNRNDPTGKTPPAYTDPTYDGNKGITLSPDGALIQECTVSTGAVSGKDFVGGITADNRAQIIGCKFLNMQVTGGNCVGGIAGYNGAAGILTSCTSQKSGDTWGMVKGTNFVGGIVGYSVSTQGIGGTADRYMTNNSKVSGSFFVGGIAGFSTQPEFSYCKNGTNGIVIGVGKAVGNGYGSATLCLPDGSGSTQEVKITFSEDDGGAGGIVGVLGSTQAVSNCVNEGAVVGYLSSGGIVGTIQEGGTVRDCENYGVVYGSNNVANLLDVKDKAGVSSVKQMNGDNVGGIAGTNRGTITGCSMRSDDGWSGKKNQVIEGSYNVGGLVGMLQGGTLTDSTISDSTYLVRGSGNTGGLVGNWAGGTVHLSAAQKQVRAAVEGSGANRVVVSVDFKSQSTKEPAVGGVFGINNTGVSGGTAAVIEGYSFRGSVKYTSPATYTTARAIAYVGGILGYNQTGGIVKDCKLLANSTIKGDSHTIQNADSTDYLKNCGTSGVGGIVGFNNGMVESGSLAEDTVKITGSYTVGGIVGVNYINGTLTGNCSNGSEEASQHVYIRATHGVAGGFVGADYSQNALNRTSDDTANKPLVNHAQVNAFKVGGGVVGVAFGNVSRCDNGKNGLVGESASETGSRAGGVIGLTYYLGGVSPEGGVVVSNCSNYGKVQYASANAVEIYGGIVGYNTWVANTPQTIIEACENRSTVQGTVKVGGIIGTSDGVRIRDCRNASTVQSASSDRELFVGGIAGYLSGKSEVYNCQNDTTALVRVTSTTGKTSALGGIVGGVRFYAGSSDGAVQIKDCTNSQKNIRQDSMTKVGGIIGTSCGVTLTNCVNESTISAAEMVGGIVGSLVYAQQGKANTTWFYDCTNNNAITGTKVGGILGGIQNSEGQYQLNRCRNNGKISLLVTGEGGGGMVGSDFGGNQRGNQIANCENNAVVCISGTSGGTKFLGGMIGRTGDYPGNTGGSQVIISKCVNRGEIRSYDTEKSTWGALIGGIAGSVGKGDSIVQECVNYGSVDALSGDTSGEHGATVGGIAGLNQALIRSCRNEPEISSDTPKISGRAQVGGIVGQNNGVYALVYSGSNMGSTDLTITSNAMEVIAEGANAGGIAGYNRGGGVIGTYNYGRITSAGAAGGLIGLATSTTGNGEQTPDQGIAGTLTNSINLGRAYGGANATGQLIGIRKDAYDVGHHHNIKMSFYYDEELVTRNADILLAVGNEPDSDTQFGEDDDPPAADSGGLIQRRLTEETFTSLGIDVPDWMDFASVLEGVQWLVKYQAYQLQQPQNVHTVSEEGYRYTTTWDVVQGLVYGYDVYLRPKGATDSANDIPVQKASEMADKDESERLKTTCTFDIAEVYRNHAARFAQYPGVDISHFTDVIETLYDVVVVTKGIGMSGVDENHPQGALDSANRVCEPDRKILPVLPAPEDSGASRNITYEIGENKVYTFTVPKEIYDAIIDHTQFKNVDKTTELYQKPYREGLSGFRVWNYENGDRKEAMTTKPVTVDGVTDLFQFLIEHTDPKKTRYEIGVQALSQDSVNGYAHSELAKLSYIVKTRLPAPVNLHHILTSSENNPLTYQLSWDEVAHASGYTVTVTYTDLSGVKVTETDKADQVITGSDNRPAVDWKTEGKTFQESGQQITFTVRAEGDNLPEDQQEYITSYESTPYQFHLPRKLSTPILRMVGDGEADHIYTLQWDIVEAVNPEKFVLKVTKQRMGNSANPEENYTFNTLDMENLAGNLRTTGELHFAEEDFGSIFRFKLVAKGDGTETMNSDSGKLEFKLYPRLPKPSKPTVNPLRVVNNDEDKQTFTVEWDGKTADAPNMDYPLPSGITAEQMIFHGKIYKVDSGQLIDTLSFTMAELKAGKPFRINPSGTLEAGEYSMVLWANAVGDQYSASTTADPAQFTTLRPLPDINHFLAGLGDAVAPDDIVLITDYESTVQVKLSWDIYDGDQFSSQALMCTPGSYQVKILENGADVTGELIVPNAGNPALQKLSDYFSATTPTSKEALFQVPPRFAGQKLTAQLVGMGGSTVLNSTPTESVVDKLPKARLVAPAVTVTQEVNAENIAVLRLAPQTGDGKLSTLLYGVRSGIGSAHYVIQVTCKYGKAGEVSKDYTVALSMTAMTSTDSWLVSGADGGVPTFLAVDYPLNRILEEVKKKICAEPGNTSLKPEEIQFTDISCAAYLHLSTANDSFGYVSTDP